jgi:hypothetical protein
MRIPAPPDPVLGRRARTLLDGDAVAALLDPQLGDRVLCVRPRYARYKAGTSLLVQYELALAEAGWVLGHAWLYADERARSTWTSRPFARLHVRARRRHPGPPSVRAAYLEPLEALVELAPLDSRLPALVRAASARKFARLLGERQLRHARPELVRHKPGRKALLRFAADGAAAYAKLYADGLAGRRLELGRRAVAAGVPTPRPLAHLAELDAAVYAEAAGIRLADLRGDPGYGDRLPAVADALVRFQRLPPASSGRPGEAPRALAAAEAVGHLLPELRAAARTLADRVVERLGDVHARLVLVHGDFYDDQLLMNRWGATVLDLDEARPGSPLVDVGSFLAHLSARTPGGDDLRGRFLVECERTGLDVRGALLFEAAALLGLAVGPFRRLEPDWPEGVAHVVELADARLREHDRESAPLPVDRSLPQLRALGDAATAAPALSRALGRPVRVEAVSLVRHKPGRRCTLGYRLAGGERVVAKTYASRRAGRVHDTVRRLESVRGVPKALGWDAGRRLVVLEAVAGEPALPLILAGEVSVGAEAAELVHALHRSHARLGRAHLLADEVRPLRERAERLGGRAVRCLELVRESAALTWDWRLRPVHRDFYEEQLVLTPGGLAVLDLDDAAMSEPALDAANFAAHLRLHALRPGGARGPAAVRRAFLRRYRELDDELDIRLLFLLEAATLLRLADIHASRLGPQAVERLLGWGERLLLKSV